MIPWGRGWGGGETIRNIIFNLPLALRKSIHPSVFSIHNICIYLYNKSDFPVPCNRTETNLTLYFAVAAENNKTLTDREPFVRPFVHITKCRSHFYIQSIETDANFSWISLKRTKNIQPKRESELLHSNWAHHVPAHDREATTNNNGKQLWWLCCAAFPIGRYGKKALPIICCTQCPATFILFFFTPGGLETRKNSRFSKYPLSCDGLQFYGFAGRFHRIEWKKMNKINRSVLFGNSVCRFGVLNFVFVIFFFGEFLVDKVFFLQRNFTEPLWGQT